jgi:hypothetical protein
VEDYPDKNKPSNTGKEYYTVKVKDTPIGTHFQGRIRKDNTFVPGDPISPLRTDIPL